jgi:flagellin
MTVINTNAKSLIAQNALTINNRDLTDAMQQLSTGKRINGAKDDAAGLAITQKMTAQIRGLDQAVRNANDGISLIQTAEGALVTVSNILQRMRELAVQSSSDSNTAEDRGALNNEFVALRDEINRIGNNTQFNNMNVLDKSFDGGSGTFVFQVGANSDQTIDITMGDYRTTGGVGSGGSITQSSATTGNEQVNALYFDAADSMAAGDTLTFTRTPGPNGAAQTYTFTASAALADGDAIADALAADTNFSQLLGLTVTSTANSVTGAQGEVSMKGASGDVYALTRSAAGAASVTASTLSPASFTASVQATTLTFAGSYSEGDVVTIDLGGGNSFDYTLTSGAAASNSALATALDGATGIDAALGVTVTSSGSSITLTGSSNQTFTATTSLNFSGSGGDLDMINSSSITSSTAANSAIDALDEALQVVSDGRAEMGATINRLTYAADNLMSISTNAQEARSRVEDTDYAKTTTELARSQIIQQAATAMLAQANQQPQTVLSLLQ